LLTFACPKITQIHNQLALNQRQSLSATVRWRLQLSATEHWPVADSR